MAIAINAQGGRVTFLTGKLAPKRRRTKRCTLGNHYGRPIDAEKMDAFADAREGDGFAEVWRDLATCSACGNTVHRSQFRKVDE